MYNVTVCRTQPYREIWNIHFFIFPRAVDVGQVPPLNEELVGTVLHSLLGDDVVDL
jgi:hypothetical protein